MAVMLVYGQSACMQSMSAEQMERAFLYKRSRRCELPGKRSCVCILLRDRPRLDPGMT